jgi:hypothetical protein
MEEIRMSSMGSITNLSRYSNEGLIFYMDSAEILVRPKDMKVYSDETP